MLKPGREAFHHPYLHVGGRDRLGEEGTAANGAAMKQVEAEPVIDGVIGLDRMRGEGVGKEDGPTAQVLLIDAGCEWECYASDSEYSVSSL